MDKPSDKPSFLSQIQGFSCRSLAHVDTEVTTASGKRVGGGVCPPARRTNLIHSRIQFTERRDQTGSLVTEPNSAPALGFCADYAPDRNVGVAMERLVVGSQDVAHDYSVLRQLGVTHILNVGYGIPNAFPDVRYI